MTTQMTVGDYQLWGQLVMSWATGNSYLPAGMSLPPEPKNLDELKQQCADLGLEISFPKYIAKLAIVRPPKDTFSLRLPEKSIIEDAVADLQRPGSTYPLPIFYERVFGRPLPATINKLELQASRIGDYTIGQCA